MKDKDKPKRQLIKELSSLRQKLNELSYPSTGLIKTEERINDSEKKYQTLFEAG